MKKRSVVSVKGLVAACCALGVVGLAAGSVWAVTEAELRKCAEQGDVNCQKDLANAYWAGLGVPEKPQEAAKWFRKCADQGDADCQYRLGIMYGTGEGVTRNEKTANAWIRKAAKQGHSDAQKAMRQLGLQ